MDGLLLDIIVTTHYISPACWSSVSLSCSERIKGERGEEEKGGGVYEGDITRPSGPA